MKEFKKHQRHFLQALKKFRTCILFFCKLNILKKLTSEDIPEHNPVTNELSKYDWYTCIRASIDHKNTSDTSFKSPKHIEYILKLN